MEIWSQIYDPCHGWFLSALLAALPLLILLGLLGLLHVSAHWSAVAGLGSALAVAVFVFGMPADKAVWSAAYGAAFGLLPIAWIVLMAVFLYTLTVETGHFEVVKRSVLALSPDRRIQALLIAYSFGAFIEGAAGFGAPVAISSALLIGAGFRPLQAAGLALIANTAPVAFGALGTPILTLANVTGIDAMKLSQMAGRQLPFFSLLVPAWMICTMTGWRGLSGIWPAVLVCGGSFAVVQFVVSNYIGLELVDVAAGLASLVCLAVFAKLWRPRDIWRFAGEEQASETQHRDAPGEILSAWMPWVILSICIFVWGLKPVKSWLDTVTVPVPFTAIDQQIQRVPPVVAQPEVETVIYKFSWLSATGTGIFAAAVLSAVWLRVSPWRFLRCLGRTLLRMRWPLVTIACMLAIAYVTRYSGMDATLGLAFTRTGVLYPFFAAMLGWLGVAITGSDTAANALFGGLQKVTAEGLGLNSTLICTANSTGGVMGKMIDAQSIVVSAAATQQPGNEGEILRYVFWHSVALASLVGLLTLFQAYVWPSVVP